MKISHYILLLLACAGIALTACEKGSDNKKIIRVADKIPGLITPGLQDGQGFSLYTNLYEYLMELDPQTMELVPWLATEWSSDDGMVWTFNLQKGVKFHDGSDFTSEDVIFTLERTRSSEHINHNDFTVIERMEAPDDYTVVLYLKEVRPTFPYLFTAYNMGILSSDYDYDNMGETSPMGTGAYKLSEYRPKESALLVKNKDYWIEGMPKADELRLYFVEDTDAAISMLEAGKVDVVPYITPLRKNRLIEAGFKVVSPFNEYRFVGMAADRKPFDDNRVRLALKYSMDPDFLASATQTTFNKDMFYNETAIQNKQKQYYDIPFRGRNIERAKELLAEAGYPDGLTVELYFGSNHPYGKEISQAIKELAAPAGFNIELKGYTRDVYLSQYWMNAPLLLTGWGPRVDPSMLLKLAFDSKGVWNETHINDKEIDEKIEAILKELDENRLQQYYNELAQLFYERGTVLNIQVPYYVAMRKEVQDYGQPMTFITQYRRTYISQ